MRDVLWRKSNHYALSFSILAGLIRKEQNVPVIISLQQSHDLDLNAEEMAATHDRDPIYQAFTSK